MHRRSVLTGALAAAFAAHDAMAMSPAVRDVVLLGRRGALPPLPPGYAYVVNTNASGIDDYVVDPSGNYVIDQR